MKFKIWFISDTHGCHRQLIVPDNIHIVVHAGDCSNYRDVARNSNEVDDFMEWFSGLPIPNKIFIPGNHDTSIEVGMIHIPDNIRMLVNDEIIIDGVKIYGSPVTPSFGYGWAYNVPRNSNSMRTCWDAIPEDTDILVTHGPPHKILDDVGGEHTGCEILAKRLNSLSNIRIHVFGHIHEHPGTIFLPRYGRRIYVNAAVLYHRLTNIRNHGVIIDYDVI